MKPAHLIPLLAALTLTAGPSIAQDGKKATPPPAPSPGEIVAAAPASDWIDIVPDDLLVMTLAPDAKGKPRIALIQLLPPPFSIGWVSNIRTLAKAHYWDGLAVYRVQDNYVTQWGDPEEDDAKAKQKPAGLKAMTEGDYVVKAIAPEPNFDDKSKGPAIDDVYAIGQFWHGWPLGRDYPGEPGSVVHNWPVHCYGMVGVARGQRPDTGDGSTLYTVIGHAPRHLDRNIALAGRVIEGMEHLSSLPRGPGAQGFYSEAAMRVPIVSIRLASELPAAEQPHMQYLSTGSGSFAKYADARANRRDPFFLVPAGGADICNIPVPTRRKP